MGRRRNRGRAGAATDAAGAPIPREGAARAAAERRGIDPTPRPAGRLIWLHAASVGETVSVLPVLPELARRHDPAHHRHRDLGAMLASGWAGAGQAGAPPLRAAGRAGLGRALPRPLAAGCRRVRRKRAVAEPAGRLPRAGHSGDADQRAHVGAEPGGLAARPGLARQILGGFAAVQPRSETRRGAVARARRPRLMDRRT